MRIVAAANRTVRPLRAPGPEGASYLEPGTERSPWGPCPGASICMSARRDRDLPVPPRHARGGSGRARSGSRANRAKRCTVNLVELEPALRSSAEAGLAKLVRPAPDMSRSGTCPWIAHANLN